MGKESDAHCARCGRYFTRESSHNPDDVVHTGDYCKRCQKFMNAPTTIEEEKITAKIMDDPDRLFADDPFLGVDRPARDLRRRSSL